MIQLLAGPLNRHWHSMQGYTSHFFSHYVRGSESQFCRGLYLKVQFKKARCMLHHLHTSSTYNVVRGNDEPESQLASQPANQPPKQTQTDRWTLKITVFIPIRLIIIGTIQIPVLLYDFNMAQRHQ